MSLRAGSVLELGLAVLNTVRLTQDGTGENLVFHFFLTTSLRSIVLFPLQISFEAPVR